jgi:hypothetical protein
VPGRLRGVRHAAAVCVGAPRALLGDGGTVPPPALLVAFLGLRPGVPCARAVTVLSRDDARSGPAAVVSACGTALPVVVLVGGLAANGTGLIQVYAPPRPTDAQLVGTRTDDQDGTLTLRADRTAAADGRDAASTYGGDAPEQCSGSGSWAQGASPPGTPQLDLGVGGCTAGTAGGPATSGDSPPPAIGSVPRVPSTGTHRTAVRRSGNGRSLGTGSAPRPDPVAGLRGLRLLPPGREGARSRGGGADRGGRRRLAA